MTRRAPKPLSKKLRSLYRWHRWLGVISAFFVIWLAASGIVLQHSSELDLDGRHISWRWAHQHYGIQPQAPKQGLHLDGQWLSHVDGYLFLNERQITQGPPPVGFVRLGLLWAVACRESLWLLNEKAEVLEHIEGLALPGRINAISQHNGMLLLDTENGVFQGDPLESQWPRWQAGDAQVQPDYSQQVLPSDLAASITATARQQALNWERVLLDAHSGRILGPYGIWLMDAMAVVFIVLGVTGLWLWLRFTRAARARKRRRPGN